MIGVVAPGQGSQKPGFLRPWLEIAQVAQSIDELSETAGIDLATHGTESDADTLRDTAIAQPLLVAASIVTARLLFSDGQHSQSAHLVTAGHSVGELSSAAVAGVIDDRSAVWLAAQRGKCMAVASAAASSGMSAVLGGDRAEVLTLIGELGLTAANINGPDQVVAAGGLSALADLRAQAAPGTNVIPLKVAGAFHSTQMSAAADEFAAFAGQIHPRDPTVAVVSNADGAVVTDGTEVMNRLVRQVQSSVRWDLTIARLHSMGVRRVVELCPGGTLTSMIRRSHPDIDCVALKSVDDIDAASALISAHNFGTRSQTANG